MYYDLSYSVCETKLFFFSEILFISRLWKKGGLRTSPSPANDSRKEKLQGQRLVMCSGDNLRDWNCSSQPSYFHWLQLACPHELQKRPTPRFFITGIHCRFLIAEFGTREDTMSVTNVKSTEHSTSKNNPCRLTEQSKDCFFFVVFGVTFTEIKIS